jgi:hypothetical protein
VVQILGRDNIALGVSTAYAYDDWGPAGREVRAGLARGYVGDLGAWRIVATMVGDGSGKQEVALKRDLRAWYMGKHADYLGDALRVSGVHGGLRWVCEDDKAFYDAFCRDEEGCRDIGVRWAEGREEILKRIEEAGGGDVAVLNGMKAAGVDGVLVKELWGGRSSDIGNEVYELAHKSAELNGDAEWEMDILNEWVGKGEAPRFGDVCMQRALDKSGKQLVFENL